MSSGQPFSEEQIEPLVRATLEAEGRGINVERMLAEIEARLAAGRVDDVPIVAARASSLRWPERSTMWRWGAALAACLLVTAGIASYVTFSPTPANAYSIVESAHTALTPSADRCYRVEIEKVPVAWSFLTEGDQTLVWTRGDRFRVTSSREGEEIVWGQDDRQRTWVVYDEKCGLIFDQKELPQKLAGVFSYLSLDMRLLTGQILEDFDLELEQGPDRREREFVTIHARVKKSKAGYAFHSAELDIDPATKKIRHMVLTQVEGGKELGRFDFTLIAEDPQSDESYELASHVDEDAVILTRKQNLERRLRMMDLVRGQKSNER